jgi:hypothetical protein
MTKPLVSTSAVYYALQLVSKLSNSNGDKTVPEQLPMYYVEMCAYTSFYFGAIMTQLSPQMLNEEVPHISNFDLDGIKQNIETVEQFRQANNIKTSEPYFVWVDNEINKLWKDGAGEKGLNSSEAFKIATFSFVQGHFLETKYPHEAEDMLKADQELRKKSPKASNMTDLGSDKDPNIWGTYNDLCKWVLQTLA